LIKYHFSIDASKLSDEEFYENWKQLKWVVNFEVKRKSQKEGETVQL
jgi:hypothetical protein